MSPHFVVIVLVYVDNGYFSQYWDVKEPIKSGIIFILTVRARVSRNKISRREITWQEIPGHISWWSSKHIKMWFCLRFGNNCAQRWRTPYDLSLVVEATWTGNCFLLHLKHNRLYICLYYGVVILILLFNITSDQYSYYKFTTEMSEWGAIDASLLDKWKIV